MNREAKLKSNFTSEVIILAEIIFSALFFGIPTVSLVLFVISVYRYVSAKRKNKKSPNTFSDEEMTSRKTMLVILSVIVGVLLVILTGLTVLLYLAVAFM